MTLIVGVRCKSGVVVGADGAATAVTADGQRTIRQPTEKLRIFSESVVMGTSGSHGLGQKFASAIESAWTNKGFRDKDAMDAVRHAQAALRKELVPEFEMAQRVASVSQQHAFNAVLTTTLIAIPVKGKAILVEFDYQGASEVASPQLPFMAIGGGKPIADPFLAFLFRIFKWKEKEPEIQDGLFAVLWTLLHAIETNPGGVSFPIRIATLAMKDGAAKARFLEESELEEHHQAVRLAEDRLRNYNTIGPGAAEAPATIPTPAQK